MTVTTAHRDPNVAARASAARLVERVIYEGAYANLAWNSMLERSGLTGSHRALATELAYGTVRRRASCEWLVGRFVKRRPPRPVQALLLVGAYQLRFGGVAPHAAVSLTVEAGGARHKPLLNAVLRKVAGDSEPWPDTATELSYPQWVIDVLSESLGAGEARGALEAMNEAPTVTHRDDGYVQDLASQWVADALEAPGGSLVVDTCAAPGGKTTALAARGLRVLATDPNAGRLGLLADNVERLGSGRVMLCRADGRRVPLADGAAAAVLVDAPCSGLGALRRRPDARWRVSSDDVTELAGLQRQLVAEAARLVAPGGMVLYSVCTLTAAETTQVSEAALAGPLAGWELCGVPSGWRSWGPGAILLPQDHGTDGMYMLRVRRPGHAPGSAE